MDDWRGLFFGQWLKVSDCDTWYCPQTLNFQKEFWCEFTFISVKTNILLKKKTPKLIF